MPHRSHDDADASPTVERRHLLAGVGGALATGLAGCNFGDLATREFVAEPYGLGGEGMRMLGFEEHHHDELEERREAEAGGFEGEVVLTSHAMTYGRDAEVPDETSFAATAGNSWSAGVLSTPTASVAGQRLNPLATQPLSELFVGERSGELLSLVGLGGDAEWACEPTRLETTEARMLDERAEFGLHLGVAETAPGPVEVALYATRVLLEGEEDETAVLAGFVDRRRLAENQRVQDCRTDFDGFLSEDDDGTVEALTEGLDRLQSVLDGVDFRGRVPRRPPPTANFSIEDARLVQISENTDLTSGSAGPIDDPPIGNEVEAAAMFDISGSNLDRLRSQGIEAEITIEEPSWAGSNTVTKRFRIPKSDVRDIANGDSPAAKFHQLARDGNSDTSPPVFSLNYGKATLKLIAGQSLVYRESTTWNVDSEYAPALLVAFIHVKDPDQGHVDWGDANGEAAFYRRSVNSSFEYLRRVFPARHVAAYRHDVPMEGNVRENTKNAVGVDAWDARKELNSVTGKSNFPNDGTLYTEDISDSRAETFFRAFGPDVTVMILPKGTGRGNSHYYAAHGMSSTLGFYQGSKWAVGSLEATDSNSNDRGHATTTAQEVGHYFAKLPYDDGSSDPYARNNSDEAHAHGNLESVGYALDDGTFTLVNSVTVSNGSFDPGSTQTDSSGSLVAPTHTSYMSYTGGSRWADNRITEYLAKGNTSPNHNVSPSLAFAGAAGTTVPGEQSADSDKAEVQAVFEAHGRVENGTVVLDRSAVFDGNPVDTGDVDVEGRLRDNDAEPVEMTLLGPDDGPLRNTLVPDRHTGTHGERTLSTVAVSFPFQDGGVWLRADYRGGRTRLNAIVHPLQDAVRRVPDRGLAGAESRDRLLAVLGKADELMRAREYQQAATVLREEFPAAVDEEVVSYEALANEPSAEELLALTDRQTEHLATAVDD